MTLETPPVHELQQRAKKAAETTVRQQLERNRQISRSARLHLIDILSRWSGSGLAVIAGVSVLIGIMIGRAYPLRTGVWLIMIIAAVHICRQLRKDFRAGQKISSRPFRWRANYTSALCILSAAFGSGALILSPPLATTATVFQLATLILITSIGVAALHIAHGRSVFALVAPAAFFVIAAIWRESGALVAIFGATALVIAFSAGLYLASRRLQNVTASRFPRTKFVRRGIDDRDALRPRHERPLQSEVG